MSADSTINIYASGSNGRVNFNDNVTLSGSSLKTISANTVSIANGKAVNVQGNGPARVFTNNPNYSGSGGNGTTSGKFTGLGATTQPLANGQAGNVRYRNQLSPIDGADPQLRTCGTPEDRSPLRMAASER